MAEKTSVWEEYMADIWPPNDNDKVWNNMAEMGLPKENDDAWNNMADDDWFGKGVQLTEEEDSLDDCYDYNSEEEEAVAVAYATRYRTPEEDEDPETWIKYYQQINESEGFDIFDVPRWCGGGPIVDFNECFLRKVAAAIDYLSKNQGKMWKLVKIDSANYHRWGAGDNYYINFQAKDADTHFIATFQALVWQGFPSISPEPVVQFCRIKEAAT